MESIVSKKSENELIAEFMGLEFRTEYGELWIHFTPKVQRDYWEKPKYDTSWDWLMPVWGKFRDLKFEEQYLVNHHLDFRFRIKRAITEGTIQEAFKELSSAINWYNGNSK